MDPNNGRPIDPESPGNAMAAEMLKNLVLLNQNIEKTHRLYEQISDALADLGDYHETYMRASELIIEQADGGKNKFSIADFAKALAQAAEEVMGEEGEEDDEPGGEDPLVRRR